MCVCVCVHARACLDISVRTKNYTCYYTCATILVGTNSLLRGQNSRPHEFKGIFETQDVVLVSGLQGCG